jgi:hypothetical protein
MRYKGQKPEDKGWAMGSGWLIRPDLLVTAGHCVFDHSRKYGPAIAIKAYIGYHGKKSIDSDKSVQFRQGKRIVTTTEWLSGPENRPNDVAFIQLDQPFSGKLGNFTYENTPPKGKGMLGVVGYPADKDLDSEKGALMYEEFSNIAYDLSTSPRHMLAYKISTFGGMYFKVSPNFIITSNFGQVNLDPLYFATMFPSSRLLAPTFMEAASSTPHPPLEGRMATHILSSLTHSPENTLSSKNCLMA